MKCLKSLKVSDVNNNNNRLIIIIIIITPWSRVLLEKLTGHS
jgi:hypothetical protein